MGLCFIRVAVPPPVCAGGRGELTECRLLAPSSRSAFILVSSCSSWFFFAGHLNVTVTTSLPSRTAQRPSVPWYSTRTQVRTVYVYVRTYVRTYASTCTYLASTCVLEYVLESTCAYEYGHTYTCTRASSVVASWLAS